MAAEGADRPGLHDRRDPAARHVRVSDAARRDVEVLVAFDELEAGTERVEHAVDVVAAHGLPLHRSGPSGPKVASTR